MQRLGRYELGGVLGKGGAGRVYEALLHGPGGFTKPVAIKVLHDGHEALRREARIGGLLRHRNLVDVYEVDDDDGHWFCAMELCPGGALSKHLPLPPRAVVEVGLQVCDALRYAHEDLGLVHLDIKPHNLLLADGVVKVADLGISIAEGFEPGRRAGTPGYMPVEQMHGLELDARTDIYALGMTLVVLATGSLPGRSQPLTSYTVDGATLPQTGQYTFEDYDPTGVDAEPEVGPLPPGVPEWLAPAVGRCLSRWPDERWPDMAALAEALRSLSVDGPGLREAIGWVPAPVPVQPDTNLGPEPDAFVGRRAELKRLAKALESPCLLTLKGPAGIGKSRLASTAARRWHAKTGRQAWFCDLSDARGLEGMVDVVARTLNVPLGKGDLAAHVTRLGHALASRGPLVVVLDNFEQIRHLASVVDQWRHRAAAARFVVTSRVPLRLDTEQVVEVPGLGPRDAAALLVVRARQRGAEVEDDPDLPDLAAKLDGLPLALELAAGRLGVLTVRDVLARLGPALLRRGTDGRHATLQAALEWSWSLLSAPERAALSQLSVFVGGASLEAAESVLDLAHGSVLTVVELLVEGSLVQVGAGGRLELLVQVQAFAAGKLEETEEAQRRHGAHYAGYGTDEALEALDRHGGVAARRALALELDNLMAACQRAVARRDSEVAVPTFLGAWRVMELQGPFEGAIELGQTVVDSSGLSRSATARVGRAVGHALQLVGRMDVAREHYDDALAVAREVGDRRFEGIVLGYLGKLHREQGRMDVAREHFDDALAAAREVGDRRFEGIVLGYLGILHREQGRMDVAREHYDDALAVAREIGDRCSEGRVLGYLANLHREQGRMDVAREHFDDALAVHREVGDRRLEGYVLGGLARTRALQGACGDALALLDEGEALLRDVGDPSRLAQHLAFRGEVLWRSGDLDAASAALTEARSVAPEAHAETAAEISRVQALLDGPFDAP